MKKLLLIFCVCLCELCFSQEAQKVFLQLEEEITYDKSTLDNTLKQLLSIDAQLTTEVYKEEISKEDNSILLRLHQNLDEYRILDGNLVVYIKDNKITRINGTYYPSVDNIEKTTSLSELEISQIAENEVFASQTGYDFQYEIEKVISKNYLDNDDKNLYYANKVNVSDNNNIDTYVEVIIDEITGIVLKKTSLIRHQTSIKTISGSNSIIVPNPVKDVLTLTLPTDNNEIKIFDLQGKLLLQQNVGFSAEINVSMLQAGTYVLVVNNSESLTFVKQ